MRALSSAPTTKPSAGSAESARSPCTRPRRQRGYPSTLGSPLPRAPVEHARQQCSRLAARAPHRSPIAARDSREWPPHGAPTRSGSHPATGLAQPAAGPEQPAAGPGQPAAGLGQLAPPQQRLSAGVRPGADLFSAAFPREGRRALHRKVGRRLLRVPTSPR